MNKKVNVGDLLDVFEGVYRKKEALKLLNKQWREINKKNNTPSIGFCYIAAEALFHLYGKDNNYYPVCATYEEQDLGRCTHWWLEDDKGGILDPTRSQYGIFMPPYDLGRRMGFQNGYSKPSKRAAKLMELVINEQKNYS